LLPKGVPRISKIKLVHGVLKTPKGTRTTKRDQAYITRSVVLDTRRKPFHHAILINLKAIWEGEIVIAA